MEQKTQPSGELPLTEEEIRSLVTKIEKGNSAALISLYNATNRLVFGLILRMLGDRSSAEETLLDVYTQVWKQPSTYDATMSPIEWLMIIAHHNSMARLHWAKRENARQEMHASRNSSATVVPERQNQARSLLQSIAPAERELLERAYYGGLSCSEMAAHVGRPVGAVKTHIRSGLSKLGESQQTSGKSPEAGARDGDTR